MARVRQKGTAPELAVRLAVTSLGHRYRIGPRLPGRPDLANQTERWAIFVHGCFWHRHSGCRRTTTPTRNRQFWLDKFAANQARDARVIRELRRRGFVVLRLWECETVDRAKLQRVLLRFFERIGQSSS
jgi:DNA mismatch endonuclease (patch repair protein)